MAVKRILLTLAALLVLVGSLASLTSCDDEFYDPIKSSSRDRKVIAELGEEEVKFELFRYIFMSRQDEYDGGDRSRWQGADADALWQAAKADVIDEICEIYAVFEVARKWGIDPYGENIDRAVNISIAADIDGGMMADGTPIAGYGSVEAYKEALQKNHCTDAVRRLLFRYKACLESLDSYIVDNHAQGKATVTDEQLLAFAASDACTHVNRAFVSFESFLDNREAALQRIETLHRDLIAANGNYDIMVEKVFSKNLAAVEGNPADGVWYGRLSTDAKDYPDYHNAIFSVSAGEISDVIEEWDGFYIVYGMGKTVDLGYPPTRDALTALYFEEQYWGQIRETAEHLETNIQYTKHFGDVTPASLMEEE